VPGARHARGALPALPLHHAAQDADQLGGILELGVVHALLRAVDVLDGAACHTARAFVIVQAVPQERRVLERDGQPQRVRARQHGCGIGGGGREVRAGEREEVQRLEEEGRGLRDRDRVQPWRRAGRVGGRRPVGGWRTDRAAGGVGVC